MDRYSQQIIGAAIEVHRVLGPGLLESVYECALCRELEIRNIPFEVQKEIDVIYKGYIIKGQRLDLLVGAEVVVELKSVSCLSDIVVAQIMSYLKATGLKLGLVINFGQPKLVDGIRRFIL